LAKSAKLPISTSGDAWQGRGGRLRALARPSAAGRELSRSRIATDREVGGPAPPSGLPAISPSWGRSANRPSQPQPSRL